MDVSPLIQWWYEGAWAWFVIPVILIAATASIGLRLWRRSNDAKKHNPHRKD